MRNTIRGLGDRMLSVVVPKATASACCPPTKWDEVCYCRNHVQYVKSCTYKCPCTVVCGACHAANTGC